MDGEKFLFSLSRFGIKLGLGPTNAFAKALGNPQDTYRSIHVAGSNGKGSVATFLYRIFRGKFVTGLYTSPHIRRFTERILVNDEEVSLDYIEKFVREHESRIDYNGHETQLTFFEYTTNMAFDYFRERGVQFALVEVGLGGRLDSTNIINPEVSVITSISLEHSDKLGGNLEYIAREKGGVIKRRKPVVLGKMPQSARRVLENIANERGSTVKEVENCVIRDPKLSLEGTSFTVETEMEKYDVKLSALGEHQISNSVASILAWEMIDERPLKDDMLRGLGENQMPGRFEIRRRDPLLILDGAHNSEAARSLSSNIRRFGIKNPLIVLGVLKDKNSYNILQNLSEISDSVIITEPNERERRKGTDELKREARLFFKEIDDHKLPRDALKSALDSKRDVVVTGSTYLVGEIELLLDAIEQAERVPVEVVDVRKEEGTIE